MGQTASIIQYEGDNSTFVWKSPIEDFNTLSQLIVHESQEAIFIANGQALDLFGPGRYTLETQNIPGVSRSLNRATGGKSPFHCELYFINKTEQMAIKWGTDSKIQFMEPTYQFPIEIGASGEMSLAADDSRKLLIKLVGAGNGLDRHSLVTYFRAVLMTKVKSYIAKTIKDQQISVFEIDEHLSEMSKNLQKLLSPLYEEYGISLERFVITTVVKPDGNPAFEKFKSIYFKQFADVAEAELRQKLRIIEAETRAKETVIESKAQAEKRSQEGYTYQNEHSFNIAEQLSGHNSVGDLTNIGVGLGTMVGVGKSVSGIVRTGFDQLKTGLSNQGRLCQECGNLVPQNAKFCSNCGAKINNPVICPNCGAEIIPGAKFCLECGKQLTDIDIVY